ncbi:putative membrane protein [Micavibrio aeruginosavorus ARL-13]|uniref:Putative membrane protein n=1 Tax=Micavibrio aeruginosavorus (strain ARL-13) TaxID=856793 RepID=G2KMK1_MICAA|nr:putative membrane protein [Micavibrio aeruginosavorus ARL-13]
MRSPRSSLQLCRTVLSCFMTIILYFGMTFLLKRFGIVL